MPSSARSHNLVIRVCAFLATVGEADSPAVGNEAITPTRLSTSSTPIYVKYFLATLMSVSTVPPPEPPETPRQIRMRSTLVPKISRNLLNTSCSFCSMAAAALAWSLPAPCSPCSSTKNFWSSGNFNPFKSDLAVLTAIVFV